ncbi:hypothetical protein Plhal304r1_c100g0174651 [Plasmopara halstedii]
MLSRSVENLVLFKRFGVTAQRFTEVYSTTKRNFGGFAGLHHLRSTNQELTNGLCLKLFGHRCLSVRRAGSTARWGGVDTSVLWIQGPSYVGSIKVHERCAQQQKRGRLQNVPCVQVFNNQAKNRDEQLRLIDTWRRYTKLFCNKCVGVCWVDMNTISHVERGHFGNVETNSHNRRN